MKIKKTAERLPDPRRSMRAKLTFSLSVIAAILLISCIISIMEYSRMSNYVSGLVADDIEAINVASKLSEMTGAYNLALLAAVGGGEDSKVPDFDDAFFKAHCSRLLNTLATKSVSDRADSVMYSYSAYMLTSLEAEDVLKSDFIDSRDWYFERLQPAYGRLSANIRLLSSEIYSDLEKNSATFDRGFYRSIIPGMVAVGVGLLLILLLYFFLMSDYVNPVYKMLAALDAYRQNDKKYTFRYEGDDQLHRLNEGVCELAGENRELRSRISALRSTSAKQ